LPDGAVLRRYDARGVAAATVGREGTVRSVVQCIPGGSRPETAREVPLDGTLAAARSGAAARWNERAIDGIAALAAAAAGPRPVPAETLRRLYSYEVVRGMAARARTLDPELHVALLAAAALEMLAGDPAAARREFSATRGIEPPRRERLRLLACREAVLLPLRWDREIGMALGCPDVPPAWAAAPLDLPGAAAPVEIPLDDASADGGDGAADGGALEEPGPPTIPPFGGFDDVLPFGKPPPDDEGFDGPTDDLEAEGP
jgi:hypothetical protein